MGIIRTILVLFLLLAGAALATFLWSNYDQRVVISFTQRFRTVEIPLSAALVSALAIGFFFSFILSVPNQFRLRGRLRDHRKKIERLESEIAELRKLPLSDVSGGARGGPETGTADAS